MEENTMGIREKMASAKKAIGLHRESRKQK
jgi:hypothetical protein